MMLKQSLVVCVLLCGALGLEDKYKELLLKLHNEHRANEGASNMNELVWDDQLEKEATAWANGCVFEHEMKERGENLAFDSSKSPETELTESAFKAWFDEKNIYSYGQHSCGSSCHYTQLVWAQTRRVGCGMKRCDYLAQGTADAWYLVCFYDPKGNMNGEKPYDKGAACTKCRDDQTCKQELCSGGSDPCEDVDENCDMWANQMSQCEQNKNFMKDKCALSCKFCKGGGNQGGNQKPKPSGKDCKDDAAGCERWASQGQCDKNPAYMKRSCKKSCGVCSGGSEDGNKGDSKGGNKDSTECYDSHGNCRKWAERGECGRNPGWMHAYCKRSCGQCPDSSSDIGGKAGCEDNNKSCPRWAKGGECEKNPRYMKNKCKKSCNDC